MVVVWCVVKAYYSVQPRTNWTIFTFLNGNGFTFLTDWSYFWFTDQPARRSLETWTVQSIGGYAPLLWSDGFDRRFPGCFVSLHISMCRSSLNLNRYPMTGKFLSEGEQDKMNATGDIAVWYSFNSVNSSLLKKRLLKLMNWIRKFANITFLNWIQQMNCFYNRKLRHIFCNVGIFSKECKN